MKVELLYFDGCPNWKEAAAALQKALDLTLHHDVQVDLTRVETQEQAEERGFIGSPTVLIDGRDPFATGAEHFGMACRVFVTPEGLAGSPSVDMLTKSLG
ncbi:MAG TPA: thioredoxin family protein [Nocardioidaceae bacterium]|nr:thioredoxin family protein [Nocardioidaceae bacterium]